MPSFSIRFCSNGCYTTRQRMPYKLGNLCLSFTTATNASKPQQHMLALSNLCQDLGLQLTSLHVECLSLYRGFKVGATAFQRLLLLSTATLSYSLRITYKQHSRTYQHLLLNSCKHIAASLSTRDTTYVAQPAHNLCVGSHYSLHTTYVCSLHHEKIISGQHLLRSMLFNIGLFRLFQQESPFYQKKKLQDSFV